LISATLAVPIAIGAVLVFGIANGVPYAPMLAAAVRERPDNPGEALAILGVANLLVAMTAVPLMGAGFTPEAPEYAFLACAAVFLLALIPIARMRTIAKPKP